MSDVKPARGATRVRETSPKYGREQPTPQALGFKVTVSDRGRLVLPAEVRERLQIKDGDWLSLILEPDGVIKLLTGKVWTDNFLRVMRHAARHIPTGRSLSDELIAERRREAAMEEQEYRKTIASFRKKKRR
jgi:AbrB family looped-hinge helix DNA binding protein